MPRKPGVNLRALDDGLVPLRYLLSLGYRMGSPDIEFIEYRDGEKRKWLRRCSQARYRSTPEGRERYRRLEEAARNKPGMKERVRERKKRWRATAHGAEVVRSYTEWYVKTPMAKAAASRYATSEKGRARKRRYYAEHKTNGD